MRSSESGSLNAGTPGRSCTSNIPSATFCTACEDATRREAGAIDSPHRASAVSRVAAVGSEPRTTGNAKARVGRKWVQEVAEPAARTISMWAPSGSVRVSMSRLPAGSDCAFSASSSFALANLGRKSRTLFRTAHRESRSGDRQQYQISYTTANRTVGFSWRNDRRLGVDLVLRCQQQDCGQVARSVLATEKIPRWSGSRSTRTTRCAF